MNEHDSSPRNLHNIASSGIVLDSISGDRILLLGDMVEDSWKPLLKKESCIRELLMERKAAIIKLPHHCSSGAVFPDLLNMTCDARKTIAILTPYSYSRSIPDKDTLKQVAKHVKELWATVGPKKDNKNWICRSLNGFLCDQITNTYVKNPIVLTRNPIDCRVSVRLYDSGEIKVLPGKNAYPFKK